MINSPDLACAYSKHFKAFIQDIKSLLLKLLHHGSLFNVQGSSKSSFKEFITTPEFESLNLYFQDNSYISSYVLADLGN